MWTSKCYKRIDLTHICGRSALGSIFVQCAVRSTHHNTRRLALDTLSEIAQRMPKTIVPLVSDAIVAATDGGAKGVPTAAATATSTAKPALGAKPAPGAKATPAPAPKPVATAATPAKAAPPEEAVQNTSRPDPKTLMQARFAALLTAISPRAETVEEPVRGDLVVEMIGVTHREDVCELVPVCREQVRRTHRYGWCRPAAKAPLGRYLFESKAGSACACN